jgi:DNA-binding CsgD family transcriptional regulator
MLTVEELKQDYDWIEAFSYASEFTLDDVREIKGAVAGYNDGDDWIIWGRLRDDRWFCLKAGCDYTGWDCKASGSSSTANSKAELIRMGMDIGMRQRFGINEPVNDPISVTPTIARVKEELVKGKTNDEIATALGISVKTVKAHLTALYKAASCTNSRQFLVHYFTHPLTQD